MGNLVFVIFSVVGWGVELELVFCGFFVWLGFILGVLIVVCFIGVIIFDEKVRLEFL